MCVCVCVEEVLDFQFYILDSFSMNKIEVRNLTVGFQTGKQMQVLLENVNFRFQKELYGLWWDEMAQGRVLC